MCSQTRTKARCSASNQSRPRRGRKPTEAKARRQTNRMFELRAPSSSRRVLAVACALIGVGVGLLGGSHAAAQAARSVWDGVYTEAQAQRGKTLYVQRCGTCHGSGDQAPALY